MCFNAMNRYTEWRHGNNAARFTGQKGWFSNLCLNMILSSYWISCLVPCCRIPLLQHRAHGQNLSGRLLMNVFYIHISRPRFFSPLIVAARIAFTLHVQEINTVWCLARGRMKLLSGISREQYELNIGRQPWCDIIRYPLSIYSSAFHSLLLLR